MRQIVSAIAPGRLSAIEIAEGALLADIGVVFQLLATYLPVVGDYLTLLVPIPFAVLILRRRLYAGIMGFCVALFIVGVLTGPGNVILMAMEAGAGVFLGATMKYRLRHFSLLLLGVTSSSLGVYALLMLFQLLSGVHFSRLVLSLQQNYQSFVALVGLIALRIGLGSLWQHSLYPLVASLATIAFTYWWALFYLIIWIFLWPVVIVVYLVTNFLVRLLGYDVRPFPGGIIEKILRWILRVVIRLALKLHLGKHWLTRTLIKEVRRQGMRKSPHKPQEKGNGRFVGRRGEGGWVDMGWAFMVARRWGRHWPPLQQTQRTRAYLSPRQDAIKVPTQPRTTPAPTEGLAYLDAYGMLWPGESLADARSSFPLIDIQHITYTYPGQARPAALLDVSLQVQQGEYLVILGHNGSGKSTLARHCNALLTPDSGHVLVAGLDTSDTAKQRTIRDMVGMIFQNPDNQIIATVVQDDVAWALTIRGLPVALIAERVAYAMKAVGIANLGKLPPHQLSGGQRQRLAIAGVLALRPQCIIADEATAQLDPLSRMEIVALLHQLNQEYGLTIIQVTHLLEEAALAQRVVVMEQGQIVMEGPPTTIFADLERLRRLKLAIPEPIELATHLRAAGLPISEEALTVGTIAEELAR